VPLSCTRQFFSAYVVLFQTFRFMRDALIRAAHDAFLGSVIDVARQKYQLRRVPPLRCSTSALATNIDRPALAEVFSSAVIAAEWEESCDVIESLQIPDGADGVNPGDGRAIFYLVRHLRPQSILEIGTHIGASTAHAATALLRTDRRDGSTLHFTTVDLRDVNDHVSKPWIEYRAKYSPREMISRVGASDYVTFVSRPSLDYLSRCDRRYDFIFLDGDHSAKAVYQEIPASLRLLNRGGVILLHDYFPRLQPLWHGKRVIAGPWLATERLKREGLPIKVLPLGELPWTTKLNTNVTSLALVTGE
jgi:predicted O-methyltransferase YrrM